MWLTGLPVPVLVSPKLHEKVYGVVPPVALAVKVTGLPATGAVGVKLKVAASACGATVTLLVELAVLPLLSVTVTLTVYVPFAA